MQIMTFATYLECAGEGTHLRSSVSAGQEPTSAMGGSVSDDHGPFGKSLLLLDSWKGAFLDRHGRVLGQVQFFYRVTDGPLLYLYLYLYLGSIG